MKIAGTGGIIQKVFPEPIRPYFLSGMLVLTMILSTFVLEKTNEHTDSMEPTVPKGSLMMIQRTVLTVSRFDVVTIISPEDPKQEMIKRIIGLPGETIHFDKGAIFVNGKPLNEPYLLKTKQRGVFTFPTSKKIPEENYFVMGDNRDVSLDSRSFGTIHREDITGKVFMVYWPIKYFRIIQ